jgi:hypothetical protein
VSKAKGGHFQLACACAFEGAHQVGLLGGGGPLSWYNALVCQAVFVRQVLEQTGPGHVSLMTRQ